MSLSVLTEHKGENWFHAYKKSVQRPKQFFLPSNSSCQMNSFCLPKIMKLPDDVSMRAELQRGVSVRRMVRYIIITSCHGDLEMSQ